MSRLLNASDNTPETGPEMGAEVPDVISEIQETAIEAASSGPPSAVPTRDSIREAGRMESGDSTSEQRRRELADFLRTRREKLKPEQVGITQVSRRRTPGLRREEVAELAGVGTTWYTWLEQARDIQPSSEVLRRLGQALRLHPAEFRHMFLLAGKALPMEIGNEKETVDASVLRLIHQAVKVPAMVLGARWDVLALNKEAERAFVGLMTKPEGERNYLDLIFCWEPSRSRVVNWESSARRVLAEFRSAVSESLDNPWVMEVVDRMKRESKEFALWWREHDVGESIPAVVELTTEGSGKLLLERSIFYPGDKSSQRILIFNPVINGS